MPQATPVVKRYKNAIHPPTPSDHLFPSTGMTIPAQAPPRPFQPVIARQMEHLVGLSAAVCFTEGESHSEPLHQLRR